MLGPEARAAALCPTVPRLGGDRETGAPDGDQGQNQHSALVQGQAALLLSPRKGLPFVLQLASSEQACVPRCRSGHLLDTTPARQGLSYSHFPVRLLVLRAAGARRVHLSGVAEGTQRKLDLSLVVWKLV